MKKFELLAASAIIMLTAIPAVAQTADTTSNRSTAPTNEPGQDTPTLPTATGSAAQESNVGDIVITAQNLEKQPIVNPVALQQTLPNVTFTETGFTTSSFTIRGIGDLCVGATCDQATAIHVNDMPLSMTRL